MCFVAIFVLFLYLCVSGVFQYVCVTERQRERESLCMYGGLFIIFRNRNGLVNDIHINKYKHVIFYYKMQYLPVYQYFTSICFCLLLLQMFAILFFFMLFVLGVGSLVALVGCAFTVVMDTFPTLRIWHVSLSACTLGFVIGLVYTTPVSVSKMCTLFLTLFKISY